MSRTIVVFHVVQEKTEDKPMIFCPDGLAALYVLDDFFIGNISPIPQAYLRDEEYASKDYKIPFRYEGRDVFIVDFAYPKHILERIAKGASSLTVIDHHASRMADISAISNVYAHVLGIYAPNEIDCGATLTHKIMWGNSVEIPWWLKYTYRQDTGARGFYAGLDIDSEIICEGIKQFKKQFPYTIRGQLNALEQLSKKDEHEIWQLGKPQIEKRNALLNEELDAYQPEFEDIGGYRVPIIQIKNPAVDSYYSMLGTLLCRRYSYHPFVAVYKSDDKDRRFCSLRSLESSKLDLSVLAQSLGGGGHFHAAGFTKKRM